MECFFSGASSDGSFYSSSPSAIANTSNIFYSSSPSAIANTDSDLLYPCPSSAIANTDNILINNGGNTEKMTKKSKSKGKGVMRLSTDPQSVAARERRHRISDKFKILKSMVPGATKLDNVSALDETIHYIEFMKRNIQIHQTMISFKASENKNINNQYYDHRNPSSSGGAVFQKLPTIYQGYPIGNTLDPNPINNHQQQGLYFGQNNNNFAGNSEVVLPSVPVLLPEYSCFQGHGQQLEAMPNIESFMNYCA